MTFCTVGNILTDIFHGEEKAQKRWLGGCDMGL
jgi:hypothetical protein